MYDIPFKYKHFYSNAHSVDVSFSSVIQYRYLQTCLSAGQFVWQLMLFCAVLRFFFFLCLEMLAMI